MANGWSVTICAGSAGRVVIQSGPSDNNNEVWAEWKPSDGAPKEFRMPENQQGLDPIYVQLNTPQDEQIHACVKYDGVACKHFDFDEGNENHDIKRSDRDGDCKC
jgi:hypothetical protein